MRAEKSDQTAPGPLRPLVKRAWRSCSSAWLKRCCSTATSALAGSLAAGDGAAAVSCATTWVFVLRAFHPRHTCRSNTSATSAPMKIQRALSLSNGRQRSTMIIGPMIQIATDNASKPSAASSHGWKIRPSSFFMNAL